LRERKTAQSYRVRGAILAINPSYKTTYSYVDHSGEPTSFSVNVAQSDWLEGDANTDENAFATSVAALVDGLMKRKNFTQTKILSNAPYASAGQREQKYEIGYQDAITLVPNSFELPVRKVSLVPPADSDLYDITASPFAAFVTAAQEYVVSPDGNPITVLYIRLIGRNT